MRSLKRNTQKLWYQLYDSHIPIFETDLEGNVITDPITGQPLESGDYTVGYTIPVEFRANVSAARGEASTDPFGVDANYDKTLCTCAILPLDELSVLFVDKAPVYDKSGKLINKPDYKVVKVAKSLNSILYAIKKITENGENG